MKFGKYIALLAVVTFGLSLGAFAKDQNQGKFTLSEPAQVGSTQLQAGNYKAAWEGTGSDVQVKILQGKNVVATTSAKLVDKSLGTDAVTLGAGNSGTKTLDEIDFAGKKQSLVFSSGETARR
jgi:hypothetical protein